MCVFISANLKSKVVVFYLVVYNVFCVSHEKILNCQWKGQETGCYFKDSVGLSGCLQILSAAGIFPDQWFHTCGTLARQSQEGHW